MAVGRDIRTCRLKHQEKHQSGRIPDLRHQRSLRKLGKGNRLFQQGGPPTKQGRTTSTKSPTILDDLFPCQSDLHVMDSLVPPPKLGLPFHANLPFFRPAPQRRSAPISAPLRRALHSLNSAGGASLSEVQLSCLVSRTKTQPPGLQHWEGKKIVNDLRFMALNFDNISLQRVENLLTLVMVL